MQHWSRKKGMMVSKLLTPRILFYSCVTELSSVHMQFGMCFCGYGIIESLNAFCEKTSHLTLRIGDIMLFEGFHVN
jgi:hypothetical protein